MNNNIVLSRRQLGQRARREREKAEVAQGKRPCIESLPVIMEFNEVLTEQNPTANDSGSSYMTNMLQREAASSAFIGNPTIGVDVSGSSFAAIPEELLERVRCASKHWSLVVGKKVIPTNHMGNH